MTFTPCSPAHGKHCSRWHSDLVARYREERHRQWLAFEDDTALYAGDIRRWKENGGSLIGFGDWLRRNRSEQSTI